MNDSASVGCSMRANAADSDLYVYAGQRIERTFDPKLRVTERHAQSRRCTWVLVDVNVHVTLVDTDHECSIDHSVHMYAS